MQGVYNSGKSPGIQLMLLENFIVSNAIFARKAVFSTVYTEKSSGKRDHCDLRHSDERWSELIITCSLIDITNFTCILILYGLSRKIIWNF